MLSIVAAATLSIVLFVSCSKSDDSTPPAASLVVTQPTLYQTYRPGDTIHIAATAHHVTAMHGCHVVITDASNDTLFHRHEHTHGTQIDVDMYWVNTLAEQQELKVLVACVLNHDGDEVKKELMVKVEP